jgi:hypothetical protein
MLRGIYKFFERRSSLSIFILVFFYNIFLFTYPDNFKLDVVVSCIFVGLFYLFTKNLFLSLFIPFTVSSFFLSAAKMYVFQYASPLEYTSELTPNGIFESVSITIGDIFGIMLILYFIRERWIYPYSNHLTKLLNTPLVLQIFCCWLMYFAISLFSSMQRSMYPTFSIDMLWQYGKIFIFLIGIVYLYTKLRKSNLYFVVLLAFLFFQNSVGIIQLTRSISSYGASVENQTIDVEENTDFSRIQGISMHANAHALAIALLAVLTFPYVLKHKKYPWWIITFTALLNVLIAQSRTIWVAAGVIVYFLYVIRVISIPNILKRISLKQAFYILFCLIISYILIIEPRIQVSKTFFTNEGGGTLRLQMISEGWQLLQQAPWGGFGIGMGVRALLGNFPNGYIHTFPFSVHLTFLQMALESGIPATIMFFVPFAILIWAWVRKGRLLHPDGLSILCCIIIMLIDFSIQPVYGRRDFMYLAIVIGIGTAGVISSNFKST